jgi:MFS-type transporter involved in bile tolerance (Atg22 family)
MISQKNYALGYTLYQLGSTLAVQPYTGLVPKLVSKKYEGRGSGIMVVYTSLGSIVACVFGILIGSDVMGMICCLIRGEIFFQISRHTQYMQVRVRVDIF